MTAQAATIHGLSEGVGPIEQGRVYYIAFEAPTCDSDGEFIGYWTGEIDTWGKHTFQQVNGGPTHYLFNGEITSAEPV